MDNNQYTEQILNAMSIVAQRAVNQADYDKTIQATIVECVDATIGKYKVRYQDGTFYAYSNAIDIKYMPGNSVYILVPKGNMNADKTIIGMTQKLGINYIDINEKSDLYITIGNNVLNNVQNYSLCSYKGSQNIILYDPDENISLIQVDTAALEIYLQQASHVMVSAAIRTALPLEQRYNGDYGIRFYLDFQDNNTGNTVTRFYNFNIDTMEGNPYLFTQETLQKFIYEIDKDNFIRIKRIELFCENFPVTQSGHEDDIFISQLSFTAARELTDEQRNGVCLDLIASRGYIFTESDGSTGQRTIQAQVRIKNKVVDYDSQPLSFYWFVENAAVSSRSTEYSPYGGQGWKCLNAYKTITEDVVEFNPASYSFSVTKADVPARYTKYKCVLVYEGSTFSKQFTIINEDYTYAIQIESDAGTEFAYDSGKPNLTCVIKSKTATLNPDNFNFIWSKFDSFNVFSSLVETTDLNQAYNTAKTNYNTFKQGIDNETTPKQGTYSGSQTNIQHLEDLAAALDTLAIRQRVEKNHIYSVDISQIINLATFKCSVYNKTTNVLLGTASITLVNKLSNTGGYTLIINNGTQNFNYNEYGVAPTNQSFDNPFKIPALSFSIYDEKGELLDVTGASIQWIVPVNNTMLSIPSAYEGELNTDGTKMIYKNYKTLNYTITDRFYNNRTENTIQLKVNYKTLNLIAETNLSFSKQGDPGTNGTEYQVKIVPYVAGGNPPSYPTATVYGSTVTTNWQHRDGTGNGRWFNIEIWHNGVKIFNNNLSGTTEQNKNVSIEWDILNNRYEISTTDNSCITIDRRTGNITFNGSRVDEVGYDPVNIVKATVVHDDLTYYATMPIITVKQLNSSAVIYRANLKENTGFRYAVYKNDGTQAVYDNHAPFEIILEKKLNNDNYEDISINQYVDITSYVWNYIGSFYNTVTSSRENALYLGDLNTSETANKNQHWVKPMDNYDGQVVNNAIIVRVSVANQQQLFIHIPVHLLLNRYSNAALNGWDGNSIDLGGSNGGMILAPQVGAGQKESDNSFTGIVMGKVKGDTLDSSKDIEIGLFGYEHGERSIFLDAETGKAVFGKQGAGQIIMDPTKNTATISSGNYNTSAGTGMEIDLTDPHIRFGSGNFIVDSTGHVTLKGASIDTSSTIEGLDETLQDLQNQIDGQIETYTGSQEPTLSNYPASGWTTDKERARHVGDLYYIESGDKAGYSYRFQKNANNTYSWVLIKDTQITKALADAAQALQEIDDTNTLIVTNYETKTDSQTKFNAVQGNLESYMSTTDTTIANLQSADQTMSGDITAVDTRVSNLTQDVNGFKTTVSQTYSTKTQMRDAANAAQTNAKNDTTNKLKDYSTTESIASSITQESGLIGTAVSEKYQTIDNMSNYSTTQEIASSITESSGEIGLAVSSKYATNADLDTLEAAAIVSTTIHYLATSASSGVTKNTSGWSTTIQSVDSTKRYLWTYNTYTHGDNSTTDSTPVITGVYGDTGIGVSNVKNYYLASASKTGVTTSTSGWTEAMQTPDANKPYLWNYEEVIYTSNSSKKTTPTIISYYTEDGRGIKSIAEKYQKSSSNSTAPSTWLDTVPTLTTTDRYLWNYEIITYTDDNTYESAKRVIGVYGDTGQPSTTYSLIVSHAAVAKSETGTYNPASITLSAKYQTGNNAIANYSGRFKIETTTNNTSWTAQYTSSADEATKTYTVPASIIALRCSLYLAGGTTTLLDQQTVPIVSDGTSVSITNKSVTYQKGDSGTTVPTGTWETSIPTVENGKFLWTKTVVTYSDTTSTESYSVARMGTDGTSPTVSSTVNEYQQSTSGTVIPTGTWQTTPPAAVAENFIWTRTTSTYSDGAKAVSYSVSRNGTNGTNGINTATVYLYKRSATDPSGNKPGAATYKFSDHSITGTLNNWSATIPTGTDPVWITFATASSNGTTDTIAASEWATPVKLEGVDGDKGLDGYNQATIYLYQRAASAPSKPSAAVTYTFATGMLDSVPTNWSRTIPATDGNPCWAITATAFSNTGTDNIATTDWSAVVKLVEDGDSFQYNLLHNTVNSKVDPILQRININGYKDQSHIIGVTGTIATPAEHGIRIAADSDQIVPGILIGTSTVANAGLYGLQIGKTYTLSADAKWKLFSADTSTTSYYLRCFYYDNSTDNTKFVNTKSLNVATITNEDKGIEETGKLVFTFTIAENTTAIYFKIRSSNNTAANFKQGDFIELTNMKLEEGNYNTLWSPAITEIAGKDAYTVILTNENHTFAGGTAAALAGSTECDVIAYKGATQMAVTLGTISDAPTGMTVTPSGSGTTSAKFTVAVTTSMTTQSGSLTIPVTVDGKTFNKTFSYSIALQGQPGSAGTAIESVTPLYYLNSSESAPDKPTTEVTSTSTAGGIWTTAIPVVTTTYKYYFTCNQVKYSDGNLSWSNPIYDRSLADLVDLEQRVKTAEEKITDEAIVSTVMDGTRYTTSNPVINLLPATYYRQNAGNNSEDGQSYIYRGITWTLNKNGSVTATGIATGNSIYELSGYALNLAVPVLTIDPTKKYIFHACPAGGSTSTYFARVRYTAEGTEPSSSTGTLKNDVGEGWKIPTGYKYVYCYLYIANGYDCSIYGENGVTFYPMLETGETKHNYVSTHDGTGALVTRMTGAETKITQTANAIELSASDNKIDGSFLIGRINLNSTTATIEASNINLNGAVTANSYFKINTDGSMQTIAGKIGGFTIDSNSIYSGVKGTGTSSGDLTLSSSTFARTINGTNRTNLQFAIGGNFGVRYDGTVYANNAVLTGSIGAAGDSTIAGWNISTSSLYKSTAAPSAIGGYQYQAGISSAASSSTRVFYIAQRTKTGTDDTTGENTYSEWAYPFYVQQNGTFVATKGYIGAPNGTNGWTIQPDTSSQYAAIYKGMTSINDTTHNGVYLGVDGIALGAGKFKVTSAGALTATSANITGTINASAGYIGYTSSSYPGWTIKGAGESTAAAIYSGTSSISSKVAGLYLGTDGIRNYNSTSASVTIKDGVLTANGANITGTINATGGSISITTASESTNLIELNYQGGSVTTYSQMSPYSLATSRTYSGVTYNSFLSGESLSLGNRGYSRVYCYTNGTGGAPILELRNDQAGNDPELNTYTYVKSVVVIKEERASSSTPGYGKISVRDRYGNEKVGINGNNGIVKMGTMTDTVASTIKTDVNGLLALSSANTGEGINYYAKTYIIVSAWLSGSKTYILTPVVYGSVSGASVYGRWCIRVTNGDGSVVANTAIGTTLTFRYIECT